MPKIQPSSLAEHNDQTWAALASALEQLLTHTSYDAVTMASVAKAAGMARNTLYNSAADKPSLVAAVTKRASVGLLQSVKKIAGEPVQPLMRIETITVAIIACFVVDKHRHVVASGFSANPSPSTLTQTTAPLVAIKSHVARLLDGGIASGDLRRLPDQALTQQLFSSVMQWAIHHVVQTPSKVHIVTEETLKVMRACLEPDD